MKLRVDLFACQTSSRFRGIGRYTYSLIREMVQSRKSHNLITLANASYPESFEELRQKFSRLLPAGSFLPYHTKELDPAYGENDPYFEVASTLVRHSYETIAPDFTLYPSIFEGWGEKGVVPLPSGGFPSSLKSVIVYDFIPYVYSDRFLESDSYFKQYYLKRFNLLKKFDLLLAISENTRQDAIKFLDLMPDRVVNISAAASPVFQTKSFTEQEKIAIFIEKRKQWFQIEFTGYIIKLPEFCRNCELFKNVFRHKNGQSFRLMSPEIWIIDQFPQII